MTPLAAFASALPSLPFTDPVLIVALATAIFLVVPLLFERIRIPGIIGLIVVGAAVGPNGFGLLARDDTIVLLGTVGLLYLMLMVGLELDLNEFERTRHRSLVFGTLSFLVPALAGLGTGLFLGYTLASALLLASAFASHTLLAYPIASRLGIVKNESVTTTLGGTIITEILALFLLAVIANSAGGGGGLGATFWIGLLVPFAIYVGVVLWGLPKVGRWFFRHVRKEGPTEFVFVMVALFTIAYAAHWAGVEPIIGALLAGLALNRLIPEHGPLMNRIHFVGDALFIPFFLLSVGMLVDVRALDSLRAWAISLSLAAGVIVSKWIASKATERIYGYSADEGWVVFGLSVPHAAGTLAIVLVGFEVGLLDQTEVNGVVLMILITSLVGPWAVERFGRKVALREERQPYDAGRAPRRILIPLSNPATADALMDLAFVVRGSDTDEPLHPLMVVREAQEETEAEVAEAEKVLSHAVLHAAGAEVPVVPLTRVDANVAAGIARGVAETRSNRVIVGWDGRKQGARSIFGTVLDQLLEMTKQLVMVVKLGHPLNTTRRIVTIIPPGADHHPGFVETAGTINLLAGGLGASLHHLVVGDAPDAVRKVWRRGRPSMQGEWSGVAGWAELIPRLREELDPDDLVVLLSARRGTLHWNPRLQRLPGLLASVGPESFIAVYPPEGAPTETPPSPAEQFLDSVGPDRVVTIEGASFEDAVRQMLATAFRDRDTVRRLTETLVAGARDFSAELMPGVIVPHARIPGLRQPVLLVGISRDGIEHPQVTEPARLVFLLVSPADHAEAHLKHLAEIARLVSRPDRVAEVVERLAPGTPIDWLHAGGR